MEILFLSFPCEDIGVAMVTNMISQNFSLLHYNCDFVEQKIEVLLSLFLLYNFISEFHNIFVTGILR